MERTISGDELQVLDDSRRLHNVYAVYNVELLVASLDEQVVEQHLDVHLRVPIVKDVSCTQVVVLRITNDGGWEIVKRKEVRNLVVTVGNNISVNNVLAGHHPVKHLVLGENSSHAIGGQLLVEQLGHRASVLLLHGAEALSGGLRRKVVMTLHHLHGITKALIRLGNSRKLNRNQLLGIDCAVEVICSCERGRNNLPCCVNSLPNIEQVHTPSNFLDEDRRKALFAEILVDAQEVDLADTLRFVAHLRCVRNAANEREQLLVRLPTNSNMPVMNVPRRSQCPPKELN